jgi:hypothetical protein
MTEATETQPRRPQRQQDLSSFARDDVALTVKNSLDTITVFTMTIGGVTEVCEFAASGDANGGDIMEVPGTYLRNANFRKALQNDILVIADADDPGVLDAVEAQKAAFRAQRQAKEETDRFIQAQQPRAFSGVQCLAQEGRSQCPEYAIYSANASRERPPLCQKHAHLASQFTPEELGTFTDGKPDIHWTRVTILGR